MTSLSRFAELVREYPSPYSTNRELLEVLRNRQGVVRPMHGIEFRDRYDNTRFLVGSR